MGLSNICVRCVLRASIEIVMLALSFVKNNAVVTSLSSWGRIFFKNRVEKAKFWVMLLAILFVLLVHIPYAQGTPIEPSIIVLNLAQAAAAGEWPMRGHDPAHTGVADEIVEPPLDLLWEYDGTGKIITSSPVVSGGIVYVGSLDCNVYALDAATGDLKWNYTAGGICEIYSSPAVSGGIVYVGSLSDVYALDAATGNLKWKYKIPRLTISGSYPAVSGGVVYVGSWDGVYALDAAIGDLRWNYTTGGGIFSSPAVSGGVVYVGSQDGDVYALDAAIGDLRWNYTTGGSFSSSPAVSGGVVYVGSQDGVYALDAATGDLKWNYMPGGGIFSSPAVSGGVVYVESQDGNAYALDAATGNLKWKYTTIYTEYISCFYYEFSQSSPAISGGVVYMGLCGSDLYALDAATGALKWNYTTYGSFSPAVSGGMVYVGSLLGVYAFASQKGPLPAPVSPPAPPLPHEVSALAVALATTVIVGALATMFGGSALNRLMSYWQKFDEIIKEFLGQGCKYSYEEISGVFRQNPKGQHLFNWDKVPGDDNESLIKFLKDTYGISWVEAAKIEKFDNGKTINISTEKNYLSLRLNDEKTRVNLKIDDGRTEELIARTENG